MTSHLNPTSTGTAPVDALLELDGGLPGFPDISALVVQPVDDFGIFVWMTGANEDEVSFLAVNPFIYFPQYEVLLSDDDESRLRAEPGDAMIVFCFVTLDRDRREASANLLAPIVANVTRSIAMQVILDDGQDLRAPLPVPAEGSLADTKPPGADTTDAGSPA